MYMNIFLYLSPVYTRGKHPHVETPYQYTLLPSYLLSQKLEKRVSISGIVNLTSNCLRATGGKPQIFQE